MSHLEVWFLEDAGQFGRTVIFNLQTVDVAQDLCHELHIVVLHRLQLHFLQLFVGLGEKEMLRMLGVFCCLMTLCAMFVF